MSLKDFEAFLATPGAKTDAEVVAAMNANGVTAADVARIVGAPVEEVAARVGAVQEANFLDFLMAPNLSDAQIVAEMNKLGITPERGSAITGVPVEEVQSRYAAVVNSNPVVTSPPVVQPPVVQPPVVQPPVVQPPVVQPPVVQPPVVQPPVVQPPVVQPPVVQPPVVQPPTTRTNQDIFRDFLMTPNLTDAQIAIEMRRLGISNQQLADISGYTLADVNRRYSAMTPIDQFRAYLMTPGLTDAQIAAEMGRLGITNQQGSAITGVPVREIESRINATSGTLPFANATQAFAQDFNNYTSIPIGAQYNPAVVGGTGSPYSQIMAQMRPVGNPYAGALQGLPMGGYDPGIYDAGLLDRVVAERENTAEKKAEVKQAQLDSETQPVEQGAYMGGLITKVFGPDPAGPDEGQINIQRGEYVIKKSSVNKYGKGLLDMINDGKIPAKKIKSLLD